VRFGCLKALAVLAISSATVPTAMSKTNPKPAKPTSRNRDTSNRLHQYATPVISAADLASGSSPIPTSDGARTQVATTARIA
jgi:hypothetical protein